MQIGAKLILFFLVQIAADQISGGLREERKAETKGRLFRLDCFCWESAIDLVCHSVRHRLGCSSLLACLLHPAVVIWCFPHGCRVLEDAAQGLLSSRCGMVAVSARFLDVFDGPCSPRYMGHEPLSGCRAPVRVQGHRWVQLRHVGMCCYRELHLGRGP